MPIDFTEVVTQHSNGSLVPQLNMLLQDLISACIDTGKKGSITLSFSIEPIPVNGGGHQVELTPKLDSKNPRFDTPTGVFFVEKNKEGRPVGLNREDPRQTKLFMEGRVE